jgi:hypothetical protein
MATLNQDVEGRDRDERLRQPHDWRGRCREEAYLTDFNRQGTSSLQKKSTAA